MSLLRTLDRTSAVSRTSTANAYPLLTFLCPPLQKRTQTRGFSKTAINRPPRLISTHEHVESLFIKALVRAGACHEHKKQLSTFREISPTTTQPHRRSKSTWKPPREKKTEPNAEIEQGGPLKSAKQFAKKELEALVDYYSIDMDTQPEEETVGYGGLVWNVGSDHEPWPLRDEGDVVHIRQLEKLLEADEALHDKVFAAYERLPSPGVVYLQKATIRTLLHHLSIVERPSPLAMQRFLSIMDDMKKAHIHITRSEWTSAIHLTGRAMGKVTEDDLQSALHIWRDMEQKAGIKGGFVTLNVLFDVAVRAGKYALAETFLKELQARKLRLHRHFRVSIIYYYGLLQDGNAVRKTYQDLVNAGDIVDTAVMNAVIAALIRAGEPSAAEHVFERMKKLHASKTTTAPGHRFFNRTWRDRRFLGLHLTHEVRHLERIKDTEALKQLQDYAPIAPDARTYSLLIRHQSVTAGNIDRVYALLLEMRHSSTPLEGSIFIAIFHGFAQFGGVRYSSWTRDKLEKLWTQYIKAIQEGLERTWISVLAVVVALKAFAKCTDADRTMRAWEEIRGMWEPTGAELEEVMVTLRRLVPQGGGFFDTQRPM